MVLFFFYSTYIQPIDIYGMELDLTVLFPFVHALFLSLLSPLFLVYLECQASHLGWPFWLGAFERVSYEPLS